MKALLKNLLPFLALLALAQCTPRPSNRPATSETVGSIGSGESLQATDYYTHGVHYQLLQSSIGGIAVINITQDSIILARFRLAEQIKAATR